MSLATHLKYQQAVFHGLHFTPCTLEYGTLWSNAKHPERGSCLVCERPGFYTLTVADYTVASDFSVPFLIRQPFLRFGSFYEGHTSFEIEGFQTSTSLPSNYIVKEANISGRQNWHENEHYKGIEIALSFAYLEKIKSIDPKVLSLKDLPDNITQTALPAKVVTWSCTVWGTAFSIQSVQRCLLCGLSHGRHESRWMSASTVPYP